MRYRILCLCMLYLCWLPACKQRKAPVAAFYYWKTSFDADSARLQLLQSVADNRLYLHFFDIDRVAQQGKAGPGAVISFQQPVSHLHITPVVFITNRVFENMADSAVDSLAVHTWGYLQRIASDAAVSFTALQIDCDWTLTTRNRYFQYLRTLKAVSGKQLQEIGRAHV